jgi:DNA-binding response OmpR family regulator
MKQILVIADDEGLEGFVARLFGPSHGVSRVEWTGAAAARISAGERFDAVLRNVPSGRSFESLDWIDARHAPKVVLVMGAETRTLGAFNGLTVREPFSVDELRLAIETVLGRAWNM